MKKRSLFIYLFLLSILSASGATIRERYNFNPDWKLLKGEDANAKNLEFDDSKWTPVHLPAAFNDGEAFRVPAGEMTEAVVSYRKVFSIPSELKDKKVFLEFEGVRQAAEVWVNGQKVGLHEDGIMAFGFDLTSFVKFGKSKENVVVVRVDNSSSYLEKASGSAFQWNDKLAGPNFGGLNRSVFLHFTDKLYQTLPLYSDLKTKGVYIYADHFDVKGKRAIMHIESEIRNEYDKPKTFKLNVMVRDNEKLLVREFQSEEVTLQPGETKTVKASANMKNLNFWSWGYGYLYEVNSTIVVGNRVVDLVRTKTGFRKTDFVNGVFRLNDRVMQLKGYTQPSTNEWPGVGSSVPAWLSDYSNGLMVQGNANLVRWTHTTPWKQDVESCDRVGLMQSMPAGDLAADVHGRMWEQRKEVMRNAILYNRNNPSIVFYESGNSALSEEHIKEMMAIRTELDPFGGRVVGCADLLESKTPEYGGEKNYVTKSADKPVWATEYAVDAAAGSAVTDQEKQAGEAVARWYDFWRERPGTGRRVNSGAVNSRFSDSNNQFSGEVDAMRLPKEAWFANQIVWDGWVDSENPRTHILGHWNVEKGSKKDVHVVSNGEKVELFQNGQSLGYGEQSNRFWFTFKNVTGKPGLLKAVAYDNTGVSASEDTIRSVGNPARIKLSMTMSPDSLHADGADLVLIQAEVLDAEGRRCPMANDVLDLDVKGPVDFIGGLSNDEKVGVATHKLSVQEGVTRFLVRSTRLEGRVSIVARSGNLTLDSLSFRSKPVEVDRGLTTFIPASHQFSYLEKEGTRLSTSYVVSRIPVSVMDVSAGSNLQQAFSSFDDNDCTEWTSNGVLANSWIEYSLNRQASLSEICLKLSGFTNRSYDLRIVNEDGIVLWKGKTEPGRGYLTLPLVKDVVSRIIRVELPGAGKDTSTSETPATTGQKLDVLEGDGGLKKELRIVEIEFYEAAIN